MAILRHASGLPSNFAISTIAIIGGGPVGVAAAKYLLAEHAFDKITVFESRDAAGGMWNHHPASAAQQKIPQTNPNPPQNIDRRARMDSPIYDDLETNIPHELMQYSDFPFPRDTQVLPRHEVVLKYLRDYAEDVLSLISFGTEVLDVRPQMPTAQTKWHVTYRDVNTDREKREEYDAVIVASGHYDRPIVPDIKGIRQWKDAYPGAMIHSKFYRKARDYKDKKVIIVGNSASGVEIGAQIEEFCKHPLLVSQRSVSYLTAGSQELKKTLPEIVEFIECERAVRFADGHIEQNVDNIIFCTGYFYSYPFLLSLPIISDGYRVKDTYQHIFNATYPTLAFLGLGLKIIPFPMAESASALVARVWSNRLKLPTTTKMQEWDASLVAERGEGKKFHNLNFPQDVDYINQLHDWSMEAERRPGLDNEGQGKVPPRWGEKERWIRERLLSIKTAFQAKGEARHQFKSIEALGFDFKAWQTHRMQEANIYVVDRPRSGSIRRAVRAT